MRIVFMGTPSPAAMSLRRLIDDGHEIAAVYTQPDRPAGRGNKLTMPPVKEIALEQGIQVLQPEKIRTSEAIEQFRSFNADVAVVVAYGRILPKDYLTAFPHGAINVHFSLLPKYRGAAPVNWAIVNGETKTGVTTMQMDEGLDTGDILEQVETPIGERENAIELMARLGELGAETISNTLRRLDSLIPQRQDDSAMSIAPIMKKSDGLIDWNMSATDIERRIRGFQPFPSSFTTHGDKRVVIYSGMVESDNVDVQPGKIVEAKQRLVVNCGEGTQLVVEELQLEGKRRMAARDVLNSGAFAVGQHFGEV
ncbi:MAG TPA: methionyl-tRNA formyltransferase [Pyrinomonadaceae bacterium]|nr:methionyl-tRNA formyltransferase [Pyrinomonadaceae bacterium]